MYTMLNRTFMYDEARVRCLPVLVLRLTLAPLSFSEKDSEIPCCDPVFELDHSVTWPEIQYGIDSLFGSVCTLTRCIMPPSTVHVYLACIRLFADDPSLEPSRKIQ